MAAADALLRDPAADQRRRRRRHRARAGVRVRHELVGVVALCRRCVRRAAGDGGPGRVLPGVDVPRPVAVRLGPAGAAAHLFCIWMVSLGSMLSGAFIMAANSWMQRPVGYAGGTNGEPPRLDDIGAVFTNPVFLWGYFHVVLAALATGTHGAARRLGLAPAPRPRGHGVPAQRGARDHAAGPAQHPAGPGRQPARRDRDALPADEDRGRRGAVGDLPAVLVLGVPDRRRQERRGPDRR